MHTRNGIDITRQSDAYKAPAGGDNVLLMSLFVRTQGTMKRIRPISHFSEQNGNKAKVFADYQQGKEINTVLLAT